MNPVALALLVTAATLHTGWNLILKRVVPKQAFAWWALVAGSVIFLPLLFLSGPVPAAVLPYALASAVAEIAYFVTLARAYDVADFSLVYPIARGTAPAMLVLWATLFLGERPRPIGLAGVAVLLAGLMLVGGADRWFKPGSDVRVTRAGVAVALSVALCISIYSTIDAAAVRRMDPAAYNVLVLGLTWVLGAPLMLARHGATGLAAVWREHRGRILAVAILMFAAYAMVLHAYTLAPASYAAAIREVSIVLAALIGWRWLGEGFGGLRTAGAGLIFAGIVLIAWKG